MRERFLNDALQRLAIEAATRFSSLVASGEQVPFDVAEQAGPDSLFHSYVPRTAEFVLEREDELRALPAFGPAREAVEAVDVAASYIEQRGEPVPTEPGERAARMLTFFTASLWDGCTEFAIDRERLDRALAVLGAEVAGADEAEVLIVPIVGLQMPMPRLQLPRGVQIVRADTIDAPVEAMSSEGMGRATWRPQFLAVAEQGEDADSARAALRQLDELASVMRIFKGGAIGLGPYAFAPTGEDRWRRIATGATPPRTGGYTLNEEEAERLVALAAELEARPDPSPALVWAVRRFELGCARESALHGLSDHLLSLRAVLEGRGPVGAALPLRAAALIAAGSVELPMPERAAAPRADGRTAPDTEVIDALRVHGQANPETETVDQDGARERIEAALELERSLMRGAQPPGAARLAAWVEESARRMLRAAALGELGADLGAAADETLIATGLAGGDAQITYADEPPQTEEPEDFGSRAPGEQPDNFAARVEPKGAEGFARRAEQLPHQAPAERRPGPSREASRALEAFEVPKWEPVERASPREEDEEIPQRAGSDSPAMEEDMEDPNDTRILEPIPVEGEIRITATDWLDEVEVEQNAPAGGTLEWPAGGTDVEHRERIDTPRVRHLFPVPEDADWEVRELDYDHYRRRAS